MRAKRLIGLMIVVLGLAFGATAQTLGDFIIKADTVFGYGDEFDKLNAHFDFPVVAETDIFKLEARDLKFFEGSIKMPSYTGDPTTLYLLLESGRIIERKLHSGSEIDSRALYSSKNTSSWVEIISNYEDVLLFLKDPVRKARIVDATGDILSEIQFTTTQTAEMKQTLNDFWNIPAIEEKDPLEGFSDLKSDEELEDDADEEFVIVETQPQYKGGMPAFYKFIGENMKYPNRARKQGIEGRVFVQFVVAVDGSVKDVKTVKGIDEDLDKEAERLISLCNFKAGQSKGKPVEVRMVLPIVFKVL